MLRAESFSSYAPILEGSSQGLVLCNRHALCLEAVLRGAAGGCSYYQAVRLTCCRDLLMHMLHSAMMLTVSFCHLLQ